ncbi:MAG: hypothetical protein IJ315_10010 [Firmicutes bacterium]|nr:hypothetical protein [Bacillota bacterium]
MDNLFCLTFYTWPNEDYRESFHIGVFRSCEEAARVEAYYRKRILGFKDYDCDADIKKIPVMDGIIEGVQKVYRFVGWNENEEYDEVDIIESGCYISEELAQKEMQQVQRKMPRREWVLNGHVIGRCDWENGFVRE